MVIAPARRAGDPGSIPGPGENFSLKLLIVHIFSEEDNILIGFQGWDVDHAVYETPWYTYSQKYRKHLVLVIMRAHRPVEITVGHYYSLSLQSCELVSNYVYF